MTKFEIIRENGDLMEIEIKCNLCGKSQVFEMTKDQFIAWTNRRDVIQHIFPELNNADREMLISGTCPVCWERMFGF